MNSLPMLAAAACLTFASGGARALAADLSLDAINAATLEEWKSRQATDAPREEPDGAASPETGKPGENAQSPATTAAPPPTDASAEKPNEPDPFLIRLQVLLDRAHVSPGVIDGFFGENTVKAIRAYEEMRDLSADGELDPEVWAALSADGGPVLKTYAVSKEDLDQRYVEKIPEDYAEFAKLDWAGFRGPEEMLAERFHLDEDLLKAINPGADFSKEGTSILVPDTGSEPETKVARIVIDKAKGELIAYDADDKVVLVDPATIGSSDTPSPSGEMTVKGSAPDPVYSYDPSKNFKQGDNKEKLTIPAGPNGPVGSMWIDLTKPTYGIHGTPEPSQIDKSASHGCVRLTNWDAVALSKLVQPSRTTVVFKG